MALLPEQYDAGYGDLLITPPGGAPVQIGELRDLSFNFARDLKPMYGRQHLPVKALLGQSKPTGKARFTRIYGDLMAAVLNGSVAAGTSVPVDVVVPGIAASYTVPTPANYVSNLGVFDVTDPTNRYRLASVASAPAAGQYAVDEVTPGQGVYTFAAADAGKTYRVSFLQTATTGQTVTVNNGPLAMAPQFSIRVFNVFDGKVLGYEFFAAWIPGLSFNFKQDDWTETDLDITLGADSQGRFVKVYTGPVA